MGNLQKKLFKSGDAKRGIHTDIVDIVEYIEKLEMRIETLEQRKPKPFAKTTKEADPFARLATAQMIQTFIDNPYALWKEGYSEDELTHLKNYLKKNGIPTPKTPKDKHRAEDMEKAIYLVWAALECNNCICALMGIDE